MKTNTTLRPKSNPFKSCLFISLMLISFSAFGQTATNPLNSNGDFRDAQNWDNEVTPYTNTWDSNPSRNFVINGELTSSDYYTLSTRATIYGKLNIGTEEDILNKEVNEYSYLSIYSGWRSNGNLIIKEGATVEVWGNVNNTGTINIEEGGTLIIHGNLDSYNNVLIDGNLVVVGDITLIDFGGSNISDSANIVAGGGFSSFGINVEDDADIYQFGDGGWSYGIDVGNQDDFIENEQDSDFYDLLEDLGVIEITANNWIGISSNWSAIENWSAGKLPNRTNDVIISFDEQSDYFYPIISGSYSIHNLEIEKNATVTIETGSHFNIRGDLTTNGGLIINNETNNPASVIIDGEVDGEANIAWRSLDNSRFWYMGHVVTGKLIPYYNKSLNFQDGIKGYRVYVYDNEKFTWNKVKNAAYDFSAMEAIALKVSSQKDLSYSGVLNNDPAYSYNAVANGFQTIANPYPSYIDLESMYTNGEFEGFLPTVYIYASNMGIVTYDAYNAATGDYINSGSRYISPCQSFWLHTNGDYSNNVITISKDDCVHNNNGSLKSSAISENKIRLVLKNPFTNDETLISFREFGQRYFTIYDSEKKMANGNSGNLYSIKDNKSIAINSMPTLSGEEIIKLGYNVASSGMSDFTIQVNDLSNFDPSVNVYLEDLEVGITIDLREESTYTFTPTIAQSDERFQIRITPSVATEIDDLNLDSKENILIYSTKQKATVIVTEALLLNNDGVIDVYDISGLLVNQIKLKNAETNFSLPKANTIYIINVKAGGNSYQKKVVTN